MKRRFIFSISLLLAVTTGYSQDAMELGGEFIRPSGQGYTQTKVTVRGESFGNKSSFSAGITYQLPSGKSYSVSRGFGIYAGYRYAFSNNSNGNSAFAGARILFSFENFDGQSSSNSLFITPWAEAGYHFVFAKVIYTAPAIGYGYTKKISKDYRSLNEDDGPRFIPSLSAGYRF